MRGAWPRQPSAPARSSAAAGTGAEMGGGREGGSGCSGALSEGGEGALAAGSCCMFEEEQSERLEGEKPLWGVGVARCGAWWGLGLRVPMAPTRRALR